MEQENNLKIPAYLGKVNFVDHWSNPIYMQHVKKMRRFQRVFEFGLCVCIAASEWVSYKVRKIPSKDRPVLNKDTGLGIFKKIILAYTRKILETVLKQGRFTIDNYGTFFLEKIELDEKRRKIYDSRLIKYKKMCYLLEDKLYKLAFTNREGMVTKNPFRFFKFYPNEITTREIYYTLLTNPILQELAVQKGNYNP